MALFSQSQIDAINKVAEKSKLAPLTSAKTPTKGVNSELSRMSADVLEYFQDSPAMLISTIEELHDYVDRCIECGWAGIDTETTGLDRIKDHIVGASLYYPGGAECYIPNKHLIPIFDEPYKNQLTYEQTASEIQRLADNRVKLIFANADFDLAMIYKDYKVDLIDAFYYDVQAAWRALKENEPDNALKVLYNKYVLRGKGNPKKFSDFFTPDLFPYCKPEVAKLYAANDAKITYELFKWQLPYVTKDHPKCKKAHLESLADLVWKVEMPMVRVCQNLHRRGVYLDKEVAPRIHAKYTKILEEEQIVLSDMVDGILETCNYNVRLRSPFKSGKDFNCNSSVHVPYLLKDIMKLEIGKSVDKNVLAELNLPVTKQIIKLRNLKKLLSTYIEKLPNATTPDSRIHARFNSTGADTGRMSSAEPNMQNIPSHAEDIRHIFRASPGYVMMSSDYSQQEPKLTAYISNDPNMIKAFQEDKDIYATIASLAFGLPYEKCLEFHPETKEYQADGKARRSEAKTIVLGILYGRSVPSIAEQLFDTRDDMTDDQKTTAAQKIYGAVLNAFPNLRQFMISAQSMARNFGYVETILGRRRHIPDMQLPEFEFKPLTGYVNPDVDPLDVSTLQSTKDEIPERVVQQLEQEFKGYKYFGQIARRTKELYEEDHIKVINNRSKITEATRQCVNCVDYETEILTTSGWKRYDAVQAGDEILAYSLDSHQITQDIVNSVLVYPGEHEVVEFNSPTFSSVSTMQHRWVVGESDEIPRIKLTENIYKNKWPDYPILRVADNSFEANSSVSDPELKVLGWIMTDGNIGRPHYAIHLYQSTKREKNKQVYDDIISTCNIAGIQVTDACKDGYYHEIYLKQNSFTKWVWDTFPNRVLSFEFVSTLSQRQCRLLVQAMLQGDGSGVDGSGQPLPNSRVTLCCKGKENADVFQYLCFRAGYATNATRIDGSTTDYPSNHVLYASMTNIPKSNSVYYDICILKISRAQIYPHHKSMKHVSDGVWCVSTNTGTWVARRNGKVYITGNSIVQGSAAELTKLAILLLESNEEWKALGGKFILPVHDELIAEVPVENAKRGGELLSSIMSAAGNFLPFSISCDVTTTLRWYGLEYPCPYPEPTQFDNISDIYKMDPEHVKWLQYHLVDLEYTLPVFKEEDGSKPRGNAARGVNGKATKEMEDRIVEYMNRYRIHIGEFLSHIKRKVTQGD